MGSEILEFTRLEWLIYSNAVAAIFSIWLFCVQNGQGFDSILT